MLAERARVMLLITGGTVAAVATALLVRSPNPGSAHQALADWARSCGAPVDGLCVSRRPAPSPRCGPDSADLFVPHARSARLAAAARAELARSIATYERSGGDRHEYAMARLALTDDELERDLELRVPERLSFGPESADNKDASVRHFDAWLRARTANGNRLSERYDAVARIGDPVGLIVAASRKGTVAVAFADELFSTEIPVDVRSGENAEDKIDAYCDVLVTATDPPYTQAANAFASCVTLAREHAHDPNAGDILAASRPCIDELERMRPEEYSPLDEVFEAPDLARGQLRLGVVENIDAERGSAYDRLNTRGVVLRVKRDYAGARAAYERAISIDDARPEAHYNVGLLETFVADTVVDERQDVALNATAAHEQLAAEAFTRASVRATGTLHEDAVNRAADAAKLERELQDLVGKL